MRPVKSNIFRSLLLLMAFAAHGCAPKAETQNGVQKPTQSPEAKIERIKNSGRIIHVLVALCDNENQGIVPVPAHLGNGQDPGRNLYWGAAYGLKTFFTKSPKWQKLAEIDDPKPNVLKRLVFKYKSADVYLVADAYDGRRMKEVIADFFSAAAGAKLENLEVQGTTLQILGGANLIAFVGHNGLMDFNAESPPAKQDDDQRQAIILACASRNYFAKHLKISGAAPLLWTSNLMAPESYILHDALEGWIAGESDELIRIRAATAYSKYQRISLTSAKNLIVTGW